jgi:cation diffusion facilitator CzcD-associated flavoprotein CzcO
MKLSTKVVSAQWDEEAGIWNFTLENQVSKERTQDWCHVLINGTGILNNWRWPDIEGLHDFGGKLMHSARWDHGVDFEGKVVGVIGTGSTSVQIVPQLQKVVKELQVYMRSPTWISPPFGGGKSLPCILSYTCCNTVLMNSNPRRPRIRTRPRSTNGARKPTIHLHRRKQI